MLLILHHKEFFLKFIVTSVTEGLKHTICPKFFKVVLAFKKTDRKQHALAELVNYGSRYTLSQWNGAKSKTLIFLGHISIYSSLYFDENGV
jgi:hypothetical protein